MSIEETEAEPELAKTPAKTARPQEPALTVSSQIPTKPDAKEGSEAPVRRVTRPRLPTFDPVRRTGPVNLNLIAEGVRKEARLAIAAVVTIGTTMALSTGIPMLGMVNDLSDAPSRSVENAVRIALAFSNAVSLAAGLIFFLWIYRACSNVRLVGDQTSAYSPGWCIGWWFIPIASLVMPFLAIRDVWRRSITGNDMRSEALAEERADLMKANVLALVWWIAYMGMNVTVVTVGMLTGIGVMPSSSLGSIEASVAIMAASVLAGVLAITMIKSIDRRQRNFNLIAPVSKIFD